MPNVSNATLQQNIDNLSALVRSSVAEIKAANESTKAELTEKIDDLSAKFDTIDTIDWKSRTSVLREQKIG